MDARLRDLWDANVPPDAQRELVRIHRGMYASASDRCQDETRYHPDIGSDLFPHERRAALESALFGFGQRFPAARVEIKSNLGRNSQHAVVQMGDIVFTLAAVSTRGRMPRSARFRALLCARPQYAFGIDGNQFVAGELPPDSQVAYAQLIHGPGGPANRFAIGFLDVLFPDKTSTSVLTRIDLLARYPETTELVAASVVITEAAPKLRRLNPGTLSQES